MCKFYCTGQSNTDAKNSLSDSNADLLQYKHEMVSGINPNDNFVGALPLKSAIYFQC